MPVIVVVLALGIIVYFVLRRFLISKKIIKHGREAGVIKIGKDDKKGAMIIDNRIIEHVKKHAESHNVKGKWIHLFDSS